MKLINFYFTAIIVIFFTACNTGNNTQQDKISKQAEVKKTFDQVFEIFKSAVAKSDGGKLATITHFTESNQGFRTPSELKKQFSLFLSDQIFRDLVAKLQISDAETSDLFGGNTKIFTVIAGNEGTESSLSFYFKEFNGQYALISILAAG